jgi:hypothetical protein
MAVATFALIGASCQGDTLYDDVVEGEGPTLLIERPITGGQVQRGRRIPVRILAVDSIGVTQVELVWTGVETGRIEIPIVPPQIGVAIDTAFTVTTGSTGGLELRAVARNGRGVIGRSDAVSLSVTAGDEIAPEVAIEANVPPRMELTDSIRVLVTARDNEGGAGLSRVGFTALVRTEGSTDLFVFDQSATFSPT